MKKSAPLGQKIGIVGGGQLARMLALAGMSQGLEVHILSLEPTDPAAQVTGHWHRGNPEFPQDLEKFCQNLDYLTFESEFYPMAGYLKLENSCPKLKIFPHPRNLQILQDRASQKALLDEYKVPTSPWIKVSHLADLHTAADLFPDGFVLKKRQGGYDGYGTFFYEGDHDFTEIAQKLPGEFIAEKTVPFQRELAISVFRSQDGSVVFFPWVETRQMQGRCDFVVGPVQPKSSKKVDAFLKKIKTLLRDINYIGAIAFEVFEVDSDLIVNEVAPRVHNSAHYSQEALSQSQFSLHLQAGLGMQLDEVKLLQKNFCMVNLIGQGGNQLQRPGKLEGRLHWYGKLQSREGRKMGHINYVGSESREQLLKKALKERKGFSL